MHAKGVRLGFEIPDHSYIGEAFEMKGIGMGCFMIIHALKWHFFTSFRKSRQAEKDTFPISHSGGSQRRY